MEKLIHKPDGQLVPDKPFYLREGMVRCIKAAAPYIHEGEICRIDASCISQTEDARHRHTADSPWVYCKVLTGRGQRWWIPTDSIEPYEDSN